jgi:hypothetical protein
VIEGLLVRRVGELDDGRVEEVPASFCSLIVVGRPEDGKAGCRGI